MITSIESIAFEKLPQLQELYVYRNPFECGCALRQFVLFMQRKGILPYNETYRDEPKCSSPAQYKGMEIINVPYHNMSCDSTSKPAVTLPKTEDDVSTQPIIKTTSRIGDQHSTEPAVTLPKTKDDVPTQQIIKTTPRIGDQQTTEPTVTFTKSKDGALTRQTVKTTPRIGDQHTTGKS
eukprot:XP_011418498.1 PREDICTED: uncharacterized protein LOC105321749 [Crassostrea gigas]